MLSILHYEIDSPSFRSRQTLSRVEILPKSESQNAGVFDRALTLESDNRIT